MRSKWQFSLYILLPPFFLFLPLPFLPPSLIDANNTAAQTQRRVLLIRFWCPRPLPRSGRVRSKEVVLLWKVQNDTSLQPGQQTCPYRIYLLSAEIFMYASMHVCLCVCVCMCLLCAGMYLCMYLCRLIFGPKHRLMTERPEGQMSHEQHTVYPTVEAEIKLPSLVHSLLLYLVYVLVSVCTLYPSQMWFWVTVGDVKKFFPLPASSRPCLGKGTN